MDSKGFSQVVVRNLGAAREVTSRLASLSLPPQPLLSALVFRKTFYERPNG